MISRLGSAVLLASALLLWPLAPARAELPSGGVYVTTLPGGADIWIDGTYVGHSPVLVDALLSGHHAITLAKAGWNVQEVDVNISPSAVTMSSTRLVPGPRAMAGTALARRRGVERRPAPTDQARGRHAPLGIRDGARAHDASLYRLPGYDDPSRAA